MYLRDNPVLQHELLVNLRMTRAFVLQLVYVLALGGVVYAAWPAEGRVEIGSPAAAQRLFMIFFLGQFILVALMSPSYAAGSITGEKERKTYELLISAPMQPGVVMVGKLLSSLTYLALLILSSAPLMVLCWLLGGISINEIIMAYAVLTLAAGTFGLVSVATSSYFSRTSSALVVSYLVILPIALTSLFLWMYSPEELRVFGSIVLLPPLCGALAVAVIAMTNRRLLYPPDVGSEGKEVINEEREMADSVGLVIRRDSFPDWLFAPAKRTEIMEDGTNPVLDKELRSEVFSQGTLMLRVVIQVSMLLSIPLMAWFMFFQPDNVPYYIAYVVIFNMLVGPVFSAGSVTQERERRTLELLLTTLLQPGQIILAKLISALRISTVLTLLLTEQILLAFLMVREMYPRWWALPIYFGIILATCLLTSTVGLFASVVCRKSLGAMVLTYLLLLGLFIGPIGLGAFLQTFTKLPEEQIRQLSVTSPFGAIFSVPIQLSASTATAPTRWVHWGYLGFAVGLSVVLVIAMDILFRLRWRAASQQ